MFSVFKDSLLKFSSLKFSSAFWTGSKSTVSSVAVLVSTLLLDRPVVLSITEPARSFNTGVAFRTVLPADTCTPPPTPIIVPVSISLVVSLSSSLKVLSL